MDQPEERVFVLGVLLVADVWVGLFVKLPGVLSDAGGDPVVVPALVHFLVLGLDVASERSQDHLHHPVVLASIGSLDLSLFH